MTKYAKVNFQQFLRSREYFIWCATTFYEAVSLPKRVADLIWHNFYRIDIDFITIDIGIFYIALNYQIRLVIMSIKYSTTFIVYFSFLVMLITFNEERIQMFRMFCFSFNAKIIINIVKINGRNWTATLTFCDNLSAIVSKNCIRVMC